MTDRGSRTPAHVIFDEIAERHLTRPGVDIGPMFGVDGLRIRGKVYAFVAHAGDLIVKVPQQRADELVADGQAERMVMRERPLREWVTAPPDAGDAAWRALMDEAYDFVDRITPHE